MLGLTSSPLSHAGKREKDVFFNPGIWPVLLPFLIASKNHSTDVRVRQAFSITVDRRNIVEHVTRLNQKPIGVLVPPDFHCRLYQPDGYIPQPRYSSRRAFTIGRCGLPWGRGFPDVDLLYTTGGFARGYRPGGRPNVEHELGVHVVPRGIESKAFSQERAKSHHFSIARGGWYGDYPDPTTWLDLARSGNSENNGQFSNSEFDKIMTQSDKER